MIALYEVLSFSSVTTAIKFDLKVTIEFVASGSYPHSSDASGTALAAFEFPQMETPDKYRKYAAECFRLASEAKTEADRKILLELARAWKKVAEEEAES